MCHHRRLAGIAVIARHLLMALVRAFALRGLCWGAKIGGKGIRRAQTRLAGRSSPLQAARSAFWSREVAEKEVARRRPSSPERAAISTNGRIMHADVAIHERPP